MSQFDNEWNMACPNCGSDQYLAVTIQTVASLTAQGTIPRGDHEWDNESHCFCAQCAHKGKVKEFRKSSSTEQAYRDAVQNLDLTQEVFHADHNCNVVIGEGGASVQVWLWVSHEDAGVCRECRNALTNDGEGYDGLCGNCADIAEADLPTLLEDTSGEQLYEVLHHWFVEDPSSGSWDDIAEDLLQLIRSAEDGKHDMNTVDQMMIAIFGHSLETLQSTLRERKKCQ